MLDPVAARNTFADDLVAEYQRLELILLELIADKLSRGLDAPDWAQRQVMELQRFRKEAGIIAARMAGKSPEMIAAAIQQAVTDGFMAASQDIAVAEGIEPARVIANAGTVPAIDGPAIAALLAETTGALATVDRGVLRATEDIYRRVVARASTVVVAGAETRIQATQRALNEFTRHGITGFKDARGRSWSLTSYTEMAIRTGTTSALMRSHSDRLTERGYDLVIVSSHPRPAPQCQPYERQILSLTGRTAGVIFETSRTTGRKVAVKVKASLAEAESRGLHHPNCFPGGALVSVPDGIAAADKRWYEGNLVVIRTALGHELSVTPNHPVLTPEGWVAASSLNVGDHVVSKSRARLDAVTGNVPDHEDVPTRIAQVFDALRRASGVAAVSVPSAPEQFHGDGFDGDVDVVLTDGLLWHTRKASENELGSESELLDRSGRTVELLRQSSTLQVSDLADASTDGIVGGSDLSSSLLVSHLGPLQGFGLGAAAGDAPSGHASAHRALLDSELGSDLLLRVPELVELDSAGQPVGARVLSSTELHSFGLGALGPRSGEPLVDKGLADAELGRELYNTLSGSVSADEVVDVGELDFAGHVYNLESGSGWYVADSIIVHNCRHRHSLYVPGVTDTSPTKADDEGYEDTQKLRYLERGTREWKRRAATALDPAEKKAAQAKAREWQARIKQHTETTGVGRRRDRERIDLGMKTGQLDKATVPTPKKPIPKPDAAEKKIAPVADKPKPAVPPTKPTRPEKPATPVPAPVGADAIRAAIDQARPTMPNGRSGWNLVDTLTTDANGAYLPSKELLRHLNTVTTVGRTIHTDVKRRFAADTELVKLRNEADTLVKEAETAHKNKDFLGAGRIKKRALPIQQQVAKRESAIILDTLAETRKFGGHHQTVATLSTAERAALTKRLGREVRAPGADSLTILREAERFYPTEWLRAADTRGPLTFGDADRGFFIPGSASRPNDVITVEGVNPSPYLGGAHASSTVETMIHEVGHRMEQSVPGLIQLEFALARSRATKNGVLEPLTPMVPGSSEMAYADKWKASYAGRSYSSPGDDRPDLVPHEVFQTGTQDLFGRSQKVYGDDQMQEFMLGALALL